MRSEVDTCQPTIVRLKTSRTNAGVGADVGKVGHPELVRRRRDELAIDQALWPLGLRAVADGGLAGLVPRDPAQPLGAHQPLDGAAGVGSNGRIRPFVVRAPAPAVAGASRAVFPRIESLTPTIALR